MPLVLQQIRRGFRRNIKFNLVIQVVLLSLLAATATAQAMHPAPQPEKQKAAEEAADRMMGRFYETLDFGVVWKEFYVTDPALRNLEIAAVTSSLVSYRAEDLPADRISMAARERAYIANHNFLAMMSAASFTADKEIPDELRPLYESTTQRPRPYANSEELDKDFTGVMDRMSNILRKMVAPNNFGSAAYKDQLSRFSESSPADRVNLNEIFAAAGLGREVKIYVVQREIFHIYLIEEKGVFRVLTILSRIRS